MSPQGRALLDSLVREDLGTTELSRRMTAAGYPVKKDAISRHLTNHARSAQSVGQPNVTDALVAAFAVAELLAVDPDRAIDVACACDDVGGNDFAAVVLARHGSTFDDCPALPEVLPRYREFRELFASLEPRREGSVSPTLGSHAGVNPSRRSSIPTAQRAPCRCSAERQPGGSADIHLASAPPEHEENQ